jgi:uncharacterized protein DUF4911
MVTAGTETAEAVSASFATETRYFRIDRRDLAYLKFILEAYEGLTTLSTVAKEGPVVSVSYTPAARKDVATLLQALAEEIVLLDVSPSYDGVSAPLTVIAQGVPVNAR